MVATLEKSPFFTVVIDTTCSRVSLIVPEMRERGPRFKFEVGSFRLFFPSYSASGAEAMGYFSAMAGWNF